MFDVGFLELFLVGVIALIILGPERLPKAAQSLGLWIGKAKQSFESIKTEIDREIKLKDLQQEIAEQKVKLKEEFDITSELNQAQQALKQTVNKIQNETHSIGQAYEPEAQALSNQSEPVKKRKSAKKPQKATKPKTAKQAKTPSKSKTAAKVASKTKVAAQSKSAKAKKSTSSTKKPRKASNKPKADKSV